MQRIRRYVAVVSLVSVLGLTGSAIAARRSDNGPRVTNPQSKVQKQQKSKPKGWIATILDQFSFPPG